MTINNQEIESKTPVDNFFGKNSSEWQSFLAGFTPALQTPPKPLEIILTTEEKTIENAEGEVIDSILKNQSENYKDLSTNFVDLYFELRKKLNNYVSTLREIQLDILSHEGTSITIKEIEKFRNVYKNLNKSFDSLKSKYLVLQNSITKLNRDDPNNSEKLSNANKIDSNIKQLFEELEESLSIELNSKIFKALYYEVNKKKYKNTYKSLPFKTHLDKGTVTISITPTEENKNGSSYITTLIYPEFQEFNFNIGVTPYIGFWEFDEYSVEQNNTEQDTTYVISSSEAPSTLGLGLTLKPTYRISKWFGFNANIGIGIPVLNTSLYEGLLGLGFTFGKDYNLTLDFGTVFKHRKELDGVSVGETSSNQFEDYTKDGITYGYFVGLGFSIPL